MSMLKKQFGMFAFHRRNMVTKTATISVHKLVCKRIVFRKKKLHLSASLREFNFRSISTLVHVHKVCLRCCNRISVEILEM